MKKKQIILISVIGGIMLAVMIFLICFFNIARITYSYDQSTESYYVDQVYGNAKHYTISDEIHGIPVTKIRSRAFMDKTNIETITMGKNIVEIERLAFLNCHNLQKIDLSKIQFIGRNAFENCSKLEEVHLTLDDLLGGVFEGCSSLKTVKLEDILTIGSYAFAGTAIEDITLPRTCTLVGINAFYDCKNLKHILVLSRNLQTNSYLKSLDFVEFQLN